jgi:hypothetical protein
MGRELPVEAPRPALASHEICCAPGAASRVYFQIKETENGDTGITLFDETAALCEAFARTRLPALNIERKMARAGRSPAAAVLMK